MSHAAQHKLNLIFSNFNHISCFTTINSTTSTSSRFHPLHPKIITMSEEESIPIQSAQSADPGFVLSPYGSPKVLVLGFGALGALYSFLLSRGGARVYAVARSNAELVKAEGINIKSQKLGDHYAYKPIDVFSTAEQARNANDHYDYILCTVKICPEQRATGEWIKEFLPDNPQQSAKMRPELPTVVFVENGIGIEEEPYATLCQADQPKVSTIITCCAWLGATLRDGGKTVDHGPLERLEMGLYPFRERGEDLEFAQSWRTTKLHTFAETFKAGGGGAVVIVGDIQVKRWVKLLWNAAWGGLTTLARQTVSEMLHEDNLDISADLVRKIMMEIISVARACGYGEDQLPMSSVDDVFELTYSQAPRFLQKQGKEPNLKPDFKPSLLVDLEAKRPMELSPIIGNIILKARQHNVNVPRLELIYAALRPAQMQAVRSAVAAASAK